MRERGPSPFSPHIAFAALCVWASASWLADDAVPSQVGFLAGQGLHFLLLALGVLVFCLLKKTSFPGWNSLSSLVIPGLALFAGPYLLLEGAQGRVPSSLAVFLYAFVPVVIVVAQGRLRWLPAALAGVAGVLFLLPIGLPETPDSILGAALMAAAMLLTAAAILRLHPVPIGAWGMTAICLTNGIVLSIAGFGHNRWTASAFGGEAVRAFLVDAPQVLLLLWLLSRLEPRKLAARWLLAPLLTLLEGYVMMRMPLGLRSLAGLALLGVGGAILYLGRDEDAQTIRLS